jgi:hypothetical protein
MFDRFTDLARRVMTMARRKAKQFNHDFIGTEHILLGIWDDKDCKGHDILVQLGCDDSLVAKISAMVKKGPAMVTFGQLPFTPAVKKALEFAMDYANECKLAYLGTEHLLFGLMKEGTGVAYQVLNELNITLQSIVREDNQLKKTEEQDSEEIDFEECVKDYFARYYEQFEGRPIPLAFWKKTTFGSLKDGDKFVSPDPELVERGKHFLFVKSEQATVRGSSSWNAFRPATGQHYGFKPEHEVIVIE